MGKMLKRIAIFFNYKDLLKQLVSKDLKLKYRRSFFGLHLERFEPAIGYDCYGDCVFNHV